MKISGDNLASAVTRGLAPIYLISGDEPLLVNEAADAVRARARAEGFTERDLHVVERGFDWNALLADSRAMSLFASRKIVEIRMTNPTPGEQGGSAIVELAEQPSPDNVVLVITGKMDGRTQNAKWVTAIERAGVLVQIWPLELQRLPGWIRDRLKRHGLEDKRDYTFIEAPLPAQTPMLLDKKADLISSVVPFQYDPELREKGRVLFTQRDVFGVTQMIVWTARKSFIDKNRAAMVDFMEDSLRVVRWYLDPKNHDEAVKIASKLTKIPPERFSWLFTAQDYSRNGNLMPDMKALQANVDATRTLGFIRSPLDVQKYTDLSIVQEAAARLK